MTAWLHMILVELVRALVVASFVFMLLAWAKATSEHRVTPQPAAFSRGFDV